MSKRRAEDPEIEVKSRKKICLGLEQENTAFQELLNSVKNEMPPQRIPVFEDFLSTNQDLIEFTDEEKLIKLGEAALNEKNWCGARINFTKFFKEFCSNYKS